MNFVNGESESCIWLSSNIKSFCICIYLIWDAMVILYDARSYININNDSISDDISCSIDKRNFQNCKAQQSVAFSIGVKHVRAVDGDYQSLLSCGYIGDENAVVIIVIVTM